MPTNDFISSLLEIKDLIVTKIENNCEDIHIFFKLERRDHICPCCGALTNKVHDYRTSIIKDSPIMGKHTFLHYMKRFVKCFFELLTQNFISAAGNGQEKGAYNAPVDG